MARLPRALQSNPAARVTVGSALLLLGALACTTQSTAVFPTAEQLPDDDRRPGGIAVDLSSDPPAMRDQGTTEDALVTLRTPLGVEPAKKLVHEFFTKVTNEDYSSMANLLSSDARVHTIRSGQGSAYRRGYERRIPSWWRSRFSRYDYHQLAPRVIYRAADIETYRKQQLDMLPDDVVHGTTAQVGETDLILRVPIVTQVILGERLLGGEVYFWMRRDGDGYVIYHMAEPL